MLRPEPLHAMPEPIQLGPNRIYILPTKAGVTFAFLVLAMLLISINYSNPPGYLLTFLLAGLGLASIFHAHRTLFGLHVEHETPPPVFAGQTARFTLTVRVPGSVPRRGVKISWSRLGSGQTQDALPNAANRFPLSLPALVRGRLAAGHCVVSSIHPLGLFRAWSILRPAMVCIVFPQPEKNAPSPPPTAFQPLQTCGEESLPNAHVNDDDFSGLRAYRRGDSPRQVAWKATARSHAVLSKEFSSRTNAEDVWLRWADADQRDAEATISRLCRWILEAEKTERPYGLVLPSRTIAPDKGRAHRDQCLTALALLEATPR